MSVAGRLPGIFRAVSAALPPDFTVGRPHPEDHAGTMGELLHAVRFLEQAYAAEQGPLIGWPGVWQDDPYERLFLRAYCLDGDLYDLGVDFDELPEIDDWYESSFHLAAQAYRREAGWDHAPGEAGIWVAALSPSGWAGATGGEGRWSGNLVSFAVLHDRDDDGTVESLAHIWTATTRRRSGAARQVLAAARARYPLARAEGPASRAGVALLESCWPEVLEAAGA